MKNKKGFMTGILITAAAVFILTGCGQKNKAAAKEAANEIMKAFQEQDAETLDVYFPDTGIGNLVYSDKPGFKMYTEKMSWEIEKAEEGKSGVQVVMNVENVDMVEILKKNPSVEGAQLPDPLPEQIEETGTKTFAYAMPLKKGETGYFFDMGEKDSFENLDALLNVITGGGSGYLAAQTA